MKNKTSDIIILKAAPREPKSTGATRGSASRKQRNSIASMAKTTISLDEPRMLELSNRRTRRNPNRRYQ